MSYNYEELEVGQGEMEDGEQQEPGHDVRVLGTPPQDTTKAFIVSVDNVQIVGYEVEEIMQLADTATVILSKLGKIQNPKAIGF